MPDPLTQVTGDLREHYAAVDWAASPLGPPATWSVHLRSALSLALTTRFAVTLLWGPEYTLVYNEAYSELIGDKHPAALGRPAREIFPEIWDDIGPLLDGVMRTGQAAFPQDMRLDMERQGSVDEGYFTYCYSPVPGPDGRPLGVLDIAQETTAQVVDHRRLGVLTRLGIALAEVDEPGELARVATDVLGGAVDDLPRLELFLDPTQDVPAATWRAAAPPPEQQYEDVALEVRADGPVAWVTLPVARPRQRRPLLAVRLNPRAKDLRAYRDFLMLVGRALGAAVDRVDVLRAERSQAAAARAMSEALQRSMLTEPPDLAPLDVAVRYLPARNDSRVGGDWYDAFCLPDGDACLVIGDVAGHDQRAAAVMGQLRNVLRGVALTVGSPPSLVLGALDRAMDQLGQPAMSSALVLVAGRDGTGAGPDWAVHAPGDVAAGAPGAGTPVVWSSAGHLPPLLLEPDGSARLLWSEADLMLGVHPGTDRRDHRIVLAPGATLLLFTDGLVERRNVGLEAGLERLRATSAGLHTLDLENLCEAVLHQVGGAPEDDIALLAVRRRDT